MQGEQTYVKTRKINGGKFSYNIPQMLLLNPFIYRAESPLNGTEQYKSFGINFRSFSCENFPQLISKHIKINICCNSCLNLNVDSMRIYLVTVFKFWSIQFAYPFIIKYAH